METCDICQKSFDGQHPMKSLKDHMRYHRSFKCEICYKETSDLRSHMRMHDKSRPRHKCEICLKEFLQRQGLRNHMKTKHSDYEKNFKCEICSKAFALKERLVKHQEIHNNAIYKCDMCEKAYNLKKSLRAHKLTHDINAKKFECELCHKNFFR